MTVVTGEEMDIAPCGQPGYGSMQVKKEQQSNVAWVGNGLKSTGPVFDPGCEGEGS